MSSQSSEEDWLVDEAVNDNWSIQTQPQNPGASMISRPPIPTTSDDVDLDWSTDEPPTKSIEDSILIGLRLIILARNEGLAMKIIEGIQENLKSESKIGFDLLVNAVRVGLPSVVNQLLSAGVGVKPYSYDNITCLMVLACCAKAETSDILTAKLLIAGGDDVNAVNSHGSTALITAAKEGHVELAELLLEAGAEPNFQSHKGRDTALIMAAKMGDGKMVALLLEKNADPLLVNSVGFTAYDIAYTRGHEELGRLIYRFQKGDLSSSEKSGILEQLRTLPFAQSEESEEKKDFTLTRRVDEMSEAQMFDSLENLLCHLRLEKYTEVFQGKGISFMKLLTLTDEELKGVGMGVIGHRMRLLDAIRLIHNKEWGENSVYPIEKMKNNFSSKDTVLALLNMREHLEYMSGSFHYLESRLKEGHKYGSEFTIGQEITEQMDECVSHLDKVVKKVTTLGELLSEVNNTFVCFAAGDLIPQRRKGKKSRKVMWIILGVAIAALVASPSRLR